MERFADTEIVDFLASFWDSQDEGGEILGRKFDNPTGSFRDAVAKKKRELGEMSASSMSESDPIVRHEVMDRANTVLEMLGVLLDDHPGMANGKLREIYEQAGDALSDLYQEAARIAFTRCQNS